MDNKVKRQEIEEELQKLSKIHGDVLCIKKVDNVNHKPHPYMIGPRHVTYASDHCGGILDERTLEKIPCAFPHCNLPYDQHTSDRVAFLQLKCNTSREVVQKILQGIVEKFGEKFIDGFAFVETDEKYRIT